MRIGLPISVDERSVEYLMQRAALTRARILLIISSLTAVAGFLMVTGALGDGWGARVAGVGVLVTAAGLFALGKWATNQFAVERKS